MNNLINEGLGLMMLGMGFVFLFLSTLIVATTYMSKLLTHYFPEVMPVAKKTQRASAQSVVPAASVDPNIAAAITAAIHQHRNR